MYTMKLETFKNVHREIYTMTLSKLNTRIFTTMNMKWNGVSNIQAYFALLFTNKTCRHIK